MSLKKDQRNGIFLIANSKDSKGISILPSRLCQSAVNNSPDHAGRELHVVGTAP